MSGIGARDLQFLKAAEHVEKLQVYRVSDFSWGNLEDYQVSDFLVVAMQRLS